MRQPLNLRAVTDSGKTTGKEKDGERGRNRTFNLLIKSQLLCQLSYAPTMGNSSVGQTKIIASRRCKAVSRIASFRAKRRLSAQTFLPLGSWKSPHYVSNYRAILRVELNRILQAAGFADCR